MTEKYLDLIIRYLNKETTPEENNELEVWLLADENQVYFDRINKIWSESASIYDSYEPDLSAALDKIHQGMESSQKAKQVALWRVVGQVAAVLVVAFGVFWFMKGDPATNSEEQEALMTLTTEAAKDSVMLSDGTIIWLNAHSSLEFPETFTSQERKVHLTGEAFFQVAHNPQKPFIVQTNRTVTKVLGTSFNIETDADQESIVVFTGRVAFSGESNPDEITLLTKNERAFYNLQASTIEKSKMDDPNVLAWKTGVLTFRDASLGEVVSKLNEHYQVRIVLDKIPDPDLLKLTSTFDNQNLNEVLKVLCITLDLKLEATDQEYRLTK